MKNIVLLCVVTICLIVLSYHGIFELGFANVDDQWQVLDDELIGAKSFSLNYLWKVFTNINSLQYSPVNTLYCNLIHRINGYDPFWFHFWSLFFHILNVILTYVLARKILNLFTVNNATIIAFGVSLVWAVLPLNIESVVWISASKIVLFSFFGLLSFITFVTYYLTRSRIHFVGSLLFLSLSFFCKEQAVVLPLVYLAFSYCYEAKQNRGSLAAPLKLVFPWLVLSFIFGLITLYVVIFGEGTHDIVHYPFKQRIILTFYCLYFYIVNLFAPYNIHYHYAFPMGYMESIPLIYFIYPIIVPLCLWLLFRWIKSTPNFHFYLFCAALFFIHLLLVLQIVPLARAAVVADRYIYMSAPGALMILFTYICQSQDFEKLNIKGFITVLAFSVYVVVFVTYNQQLVANWIPKNINIT